MIAKLKSMSPFKVLAIVAGLSFTLLVVGIFLFVGRYESSFLPNQSAQGVEIEGLSADEAEQKIESEIQKHKISIHYDDEEKIYNPNELGFSLQGERLESELESREWQSYFTSFFDSQELDVEIILDEETLDSELQELSSSLNKEPTQKVVKTFTSGKDSVVTTKGKKGREVSNLDSVKDEITTFLENPRPIVAEISFKEIDFKTKTIEVDDKTSPTTTITYTIQSRGNISSSLATFSELVAQTLASSKGWTKAGYAFREVSSGGSIKLTLATPSAFDAASSGCSAKWSCRVGDLILINEERWNNATDSWNKDGGSLRDYRHMVVNHEVGHYLSKGHVNCPGAGALAPVMQQQSIDLQGCKHNPWPLSYEL